LTTPQIEAAGKALAMEYLIFDFVDELDFTAQFDRAVAAMPQFVYIDGDAYFATKSDLLAALQIKNRLPLITGSSAGNGTYIVLGYGPNTGAVARRTGYYVDAILKGAKPGDLPVELPTVFDLVIRSRLQKQSA
jgi:putative ABC transport system substrate-binding protein